MPEPVDERELLRRQVEQTLRFVATSTVVGVVVIAILAAVVSGARGLLVLIGIVYLVTSVTAYFVLRHIGTRANIDAVAAGLAAGLAIAIKPSNALFLPAAAGALLVGRRARGLALLVLALLPAILGLAIWRDRGLGHVFGFALWTFYISLSNSSWTGRSSIPASAAAASSESMCMSGSMIASFRLPH